MDKIEQARRDGMMYALRVAEEKGIEGLADEIKFRGITEAPLRISKTAAQEFENNVRRNVFGTIQVLAVAVLNQEFGFGHKRMKRFCDRFLNLYECIRDEYATWDDYVNCYSEELGIDLSFKKNDKDVII